MISRPRALQQRAFLRYCLSGRRWPLRRAFAGRVLLGAMLGMLPPEALSAIQLFNPWEEALGSRLGQCSGMPPEKTPG
jgi:hypothetical protein